MKRETITISVGHGMKGFILRRASSDFRSVSEYIRHLVSRDDYYLRDLSRKRVGRQRHDGSRRGLIDDKEPHGVLDP